ncbi:MAG: hypothetical protein GC145_03775 [Caulobacter sp.]|nr:hypothetical protein [Caulobacter sp.]
MMILAILLALDAGQGQPPLPPEQMACVTELAPRYATAPETADLIADAIAQECFYRLPTTKGYRACYVVPGCEVRNRGYAQDEIDHMRAQALLEVVRLRSRPPT